MTDTTETMTDTTEMLSDSPDLAPMCNVPFVMPINYEMLIWMHNTYLSMMHRRCALEVCKRGQKRSRRPEV